MQPRIEASFFFFPAEGRERRSHLSWPLSSPLPGISGGSRAVDNDSCWETGHCVGAPLGSSSREVSVPPSPPGDAQLQPARSSEAGAQGRGSNLKRKKKKKSHSRNSQLTFLLSISLPGKKPHKQRMAAAMHFLLVRVLLKLLNVQTSTFLFVSFVCVVISYPLQFSQGLCTPNHQNQSPKKTVLHPRWKDAEV